MRFVPPSELRLQCAECGVPVETVGEPECWSIDFQPCGHRVFAADFSALAAQIGSES